MCITVSYFSFTSTAMLCFQGLYEQAVKPQEVARDPDQGIYWTHLYTNILNSAYLVFDAQNDTWSSARQWSLYLKHVDINNEHTSLHWHLIEDLLQRLLSVLFLCGLKCCRFSPVGSYPPTVCRTFSSCFHEIRKSYFSLRQWTEIPWDAAFCSACEFQSTSVD